MHSFGGFALTSGPEVSSKTRLRAGPHSQSISEALGLALTVGLGRLRAPILILVRRLLRTLLPAWVNHRLLIHCAGGVRTQNMKWSILIPDTAASRFDVG